MAVSIPRSKAFIPLHQGNSAWQWCPPSPATSPTHSGTSLPKYKSSDVPFLQSFPACQWLQKATHYNGSPGHLGAKLQIPAHLPSRSFIFWLRSAHPALHLLQITYPPPTVAHFSKFLGPQARFPSSFLCLQTD